MKSSPIITRKNSKKNKSQRHNAIETEESHNPTATNPMTSVVKHKKSVQAPTESAADTTTITMNAQSIPIELDLLEPLDKIYKDSGPNQDYEPIKANGSTDHVHANRDNPETPPTAAEDSLTLPTGEALVHEPPSGTYFQRFTTTTISRPGAVSVRGVGRTGGDDDAEAPTRIDSQATEPTLIVAEVVDEQARELALRNAILSSAVVAEEVRWTNVNFYDADSQQLQAKQRQRRVCWILGSAIALVVAMAIAIGLGITIQSRTTGLQSSSNQTEYTKGPEPSSNASTPRRTTYALQGGTVNLTTATSSGGSPRPVSSADVTSSALSRNGSVAAFALEEHILLFHYDLNQDSWKALGPPISNPNLAPNPWDPFPRLSLSDSGYSVAISAPAHQNHTGRVRVFDYRHGSWIQRGSALVGNTSRTDGGADAFGHAVDLSGDGMVLAVAASNEDDWEHLNSYAQIWHWNDTHQTWTYVDQVNYHSLDLAMTLSGDGTVLGLGDTQDGTDPGRAAVWKCVPDSGCTPLGQEIAGTDYEDMAGTAVSLSDDGSVLAIGAPGSGECEGRPYCGNVRVFQYAPDGSEDLWVQRGQMISGGNYFGGRLQLSSDGTILAVQGVTSGNVLDDLGPDGYFVQLYQLNSGGAWQSLLDDPVNGTLLAMSCDASNLAVTWVDGSIRVLELDLA